MLGRCKTCSNQINFKASLCLKCGDNNLTYLATLSRLKIEDLGVLLLAMGTLVYIFINFSLI